MKKLIQLMTNTELVLLILNFTLCIVCLWINKQQDTSIAIVTC